MANKNDDQLPDPAAEAEARDLVDHPRYPAPVVDLTRPPWDAVSYPAENAAGALLLESTGEGELEGLEKLVEISSRAGYAAIHDPIVLRLLPGTYVVTLSEDEGAEGRSARMKVRLSPPGEPAVPVLDVVISPGGVAPRLIIPNGHRLVAPDDPHTLEQKED